MARVLAHWNNHQAIIFNRIRPPRKVAAMKRAEFETIIQAGEDALLQSDPIIALHILGGSPPPALLTKLRVLIRMASRDLQKILKTPEA